MTPDRQDTIPQDIRELVETARPDQIRRLLADIMSGRIVLGDSPVPTHTPDTKGRLN
jgi:hypothetical protein